MSKKLIESTKVTIPVSIPKGAIMRDENFLSMHQVVEFQFQKVRL